MNTIFTIGHSTHPLEEFIRWLHAHGIESLADIRTIPYSRHNPQYNAEPLAHALAEANIAYCHIKDLGGRRSPDKHSVNDGWRNAGFRGYADYMQTAAFEQALDRLIAIAKNARTAIMCAEAVPWRCHRSLVADALTVRRIEVRHIMPDGEAKPHHLTSFAQIKEGGVVYPSLEPVQLELSDLK